MTHQTTILSTKKLLQEQKQLLLDAPLTLIEEEFISTTYLFPVLDNLGDALIFTSQNAVISLLQHTHCEELKSKEVFCVGIKTRNLLVENGFNVVAHTSYASDLAEIISLIYNRNTYTFFSGNLRRDTLPNMLKQNNIVFNEIEVYQTHLTPKKISDSIDGILFFSPSAVESYLECNTLKNETCFCIGETTARALENKKVKNIVVAEKPLVESVLNDVKQYFEKQSEFTIK